MTPAQNTKLIIAQLNDYLDQGHYQLAKAEFDRLADRINCEDFDLYISNHKQEFLWTMQ